jgi:mono/diheme cytochrome c family protein
MGRRYVLLCMISAMAGLAFSAIAQERANSAVSSRSAMPASATGTAAAPASTTKPATTAAADAAEERVMRLEGEKRFRTNCGRCHQAPHKFPPRVMASAIRHMRVRATITDEDMRLILRYMTR